MDTPLRWRGHEVSRLEGFSDTVFAFALTLLVVALEVPHNYEKLMELMRGFPAFACSFALLIWIWSEHNTFFRRFGLQDAYTITLNAVLLFLVLFYVYPLKFMFDTMFSSFQHGSEGRIRLDAYQFGNTSAIYAAGFVAMFVVFALLYHHAYASREKLGLSALDAFEARAAVERQLVSVGVGLVSLFVATLAPLRLVGLAPMCFMLMWPAHWIHGSAARKRRTALQTRLTSGEQAADTPVI
ncbi:MAG: TMEM175 family protein [Acidobacteriota bacterium]